MTIQVQCSCGKQVRVADEQSGRRVRCPSCQGLVRLPGEPIKQDSYATKKVRKCPSCKHEWPEDALICINCGFHFETGRKMQTEYQLVDRFVDDGVIWLGCYWRYRIFRGRAGHPHLHVSQRVFFVPVFGLLTGTYNLRDYSAILTDFTPGDGVRIPDVQHIELEGAGKKRNVRIYSSANETKFKEVIDLIAEAGRLEIKRK